MPKSLLVGFTRTELLAPGDKETVCIPVNLVDLRLMSPGGSEFGLLPGSYSLLVGPSSPGSNGKFVKSPLASPLEVQLVLS